MLRHVSEAFAEDPGPHPPRRALRRALRFLVVADDTMELMQEMVALGRSGLPRARARLAGVRSRPGRAASRADVRGAAALRGFLPKAFPELKAWPAALLGLGAGALRAARLAARRIGSQGAVRAAARAERGARARACRGSEARRRSKASTPDALLGLLKGADAFRRPERFAELLEVARLAEPGIDTRAHGARAALPRPRWTRARSQPRRPRPRRSAEAGRRGAPEGDQRTLLISQTSSEKTSVLARGM